MVNKQLLTKLRIKMDKTKKKEGKSNFQYQAISRQEFLLFYPKIFGLTVLSQTFSTFDADRTPCRNSDKYLFCLVLLVHSFLQNNVYAQTDICRRNKSMCMFYRA